MEAIYNTAYPDVEQVNDTHESLNLYYHNPGLIEGRLYELEQELSIERLVQIGAASLSIGSLLMALTGKKKWLFFSMGISAMLIKSASQGWCPAMNLLYRLGYRKQAEIDKEKYALKAIRGDFNLGLDVPNAVYEAVNK
jgi:hypothetical protein